MVRRILCGVLIVPFILVGCADKEAMDQYYQVEAARTQAIIDSIESQHKANTQTRTLQMKSFSTAATNAAVTESPVDDALLAFAWGYQMGQPLEIEMPKLNTIKAPDTSADMIRAWTPIVGMAMPFLYPLAYGWASSGGGNSYNATDNAKINISSENAGSYNQAGGDQNLDTTFSPVEEDCINCSTDDSSGGVEGEGEPTNPIEGGDTCEVSGGYLNPADGKYYADEFYTCSCGSRDAGHC